MNTTLGRPNISKTLKFLRFENDPVSILVHLSSFDSFSVSSPSKYLKSPLMMKVTGLAEMSRYFKFRSLGQADVRPKLKFGISLKETSRERRDGLFKISSFRTEMALWDKLR